MIGPLHPVVIGPHAGTSPNVPGTLDLVSVTIESAGHLIRQG